MMLVGGAVTVFVLGLRHGADPDHLAAIDNVTRNSYQRSPRLSRFVGTLFAGGHTVMVMAISILVGLLGQRFSAHAETIERVGTYLSIAVLVALAAVNIRTLRRGGTALTGIKTRLLPKRLREGTSALLAIPIGLLFGFGFETSSQIATYAVAFSSTAGLVGAVIVGAMFCLGMIVTDTLDSVLVHRLVSYRRTALPRVMRTWIWSVTLVAIAVAAYEFAQVLGWQSPVSDLAFSALLVSALVSVFVYVFVKTRSMAEIAPMAPPTGEVIP